MTIHFLEVAQQGWPPLRFFMAKVYTDLSLS
jgi:hypothetical protein